MQYLTQFWNIFQVAFGLGLVIFLHELGHFLLAKWNDVKVEKFSIGFGPTIFGFKRGETEYVLAAVPLGGFVKMLGEGIEEGEAKTSDPRAYPNKSVGGRMAIISAGVVMNLFLGLACFVYAYGHGMEEMPARIGRVVGGSPAYEAGFRVGDEVVAIDGRKDISFQNIVMKTSLSTAGQVIHFEVKRPGESGTVAVNAMPRRETNRDTPSIGVGPSESLELDEPPFEAPAGLPAAETPSERGFEPEDKIVAVSPDGENPISVDDIGVFHRLAAKYRDQPLNFIVERRGDTKNGKRTSKELTKASIKLPPNHFVDFGFQLTIEPVSSIQGGSIAERAGFRKGDLIKKVNGEAFDPMKLPDICYRNAGKATTFEIERSEPGKATPVTTEIKVVPDDTPPWTEHVLSPALGEPLEIPGLGLAYPVRTKITAITPDSPAAKAGLKVGDVINAMTLPPKPSSNGKKTEKPEPIEFTDAHPNWAATFAALQVLPLREVQLTVNGSNVPISLTPAPDPNWFHPMRGLQFMGLIRNVPPLGAMAALRRGADDTVENVLGIYAMLRSLIMQRVSPKGLAGPLTIFRFAYHSAGMGLTKLVHFLGLLSINLAVLNFLPIPPLDGGQMVFLLAEKVRGKPLPESALAAGTYAGLALVLLLMIYVLCQDVLRMFF